MSEAIAAPEVTTPAPQSEPAAAPQNINEATDAALAAKEKEAAPPAAPAPEPAKPPEPRNPKSDRFVAAMEREKSLREVERRAKASVSELQRREAEYKARLAAAGDPSADPIAYLEKLGIPFEKVVSSITAREPPKVEDKVRELETRLETFKREQAEAAQRAAIEQQKADLEEFNRHVVSYVAKDTEKNELIGAFNATEYVPTFIQQYAQQYGKVLDVDEAARLVREDLEATVDRIAATKWFQAKYQKVGASAPQSNPAKAVVSGEAQKPEARTLTSGATASAAAVQQAAQAPMNEAERRAKALEAFQEVLKRSSGNP